MGTKRESTQSKTERAIDALRKYASGISKQERDKIQRELEQEGSDDEPSVNDPSFTTITYKGLKIAVPIQYSDAKYIPIPNTWADKGHWISISNSDVWNTPAQKQQIEEEVQDVNFED
jgi:hypothetical protein